jgi:ribonuclease-3
MGLVDLVVSFATSPETKKKRICGDALEALMGAMYLDRGYEKTHKYFTGHVLKNYINIQQLTFTETDFKSRLLEWGQKYKLEVGFEIIGEHREKSQSSPLFSVQVTISGVPIAKGKAKSKKEAEQMASQKALTFITTSAESSVDALIQYLERMSEKKNNG